MLVKVEYMFHGLCVEAKRRKIKAEIALALALVQKLEKKLNVQIQIIAFLKKNLGALDPFTYIYYH